MNLNPVTLMGYFFLILFASLALLVMAYPLIPQTINSIKAYFNPELIKIIKTNTRDTINATILWCLFLNGCRYIMN